IYPSLWFLPKNLEKCTIEIGYQKFEFEAKQNCASNSNEEIAPEFCPIELKREQVIAEEGIAEISVSGSCSGKAKVFITQNGFTDFTIEG
ncbi:MAG: hypothetical protein Q7K42_04695, partial [Candidatus Diapherotrites archaeon]|nr:hypothetical protein [Candidatus Diapherotrites archaeon]